MQVRGSCQEVLRNMLKSIPASISSSFVRFRPQSERSIVPSPAGVVDIRVVEVVDGIEVVREIELHGSTCRLAVDRAEVGTGAIPGPAVTLLLARSQASC